MELKDSHRAEDSAESDLREFESHADFDPEDSEPRPFTPPDRKRVLTVALILVILLLAAVLPPLVSVNRYRQRIAGSISASLGRPVRIGSVTLNMLPLPGFTLENFVVSEDPAFGIEPVIRADKVNARLRVSSLWGRRVEFSRITLEDPSVNLVHHADGRWNVESIFLQASKIEAAPTAQRGAGGAPRFPYIEATGARVNIKNGLEKQPISLTEADLALWLPDPQQWRLRLEGRPARTDTAASDTGTIRVQGTLGKASSLKDIPLNLTAEWRNAPLGAASWVVMGRDAGFRGDMTLRLQVEGTAGANELNSRLELRNVRRAEFVPAQPMDVDVECRAGLTRIFHQLSDVHCAWPVDADKAGLVLTGQMPEILEPAGATGAVRLKNVPAQGLLDALRLVSPRVAPDLTAAGKVSGEVAKPGAGAATGSVVITEAQLKLGDTAPFVDGEVGGEFAGGGLTVHPIGLKLGAPSPASLDGRVTGEGYTMHLSGPAVRSRLLQLAAALPQFGDGLAEALTAAVDATDAETPMRIDLTSSHTWGQAQVWTAAAVAKPAAKRVGRRRH